MRSQFNESLFTPILLLVVFALIFLSGFIPEDTLGINENPYFAVVIIQLLVYAIPALFYCRIRGRKFNEKLKLRFFPPSQLLYLLYATVFLVCGSFLISIFMYNTFPDAFASSSVTEYAAFALNNRFFDVVYLFVTFALLPAVTEEFMFRGIVNGEYEHSGVGLAVIMSSIVFAMSHFSVARFPVYFFAGIVISVVSYTTRSLFASIIIHTVNNAVVLLCEKYVLRIVDKQNVSMMLLIIISGAAAIAFLMLMCYESYGIYKGYGENNVPSEYAQSKKKNIFSRVVKVFFSPTFILLVIFFVVVSIARM